MHEDMFHDEIVHEMSSWDNQATEQVTSFLAAN